MARRFPSRETRELVEWAESHGWRMGPYTGTGHIRLIHRTGKSYTIAATPSDWRGLQNAKSALLRTVGERESKPNAAKYKKGDRSAPRFIDTRARDYGEDAPWKTAAADLADIDAELATLSPRRHRARMVELAHKRLACCEILEMFHKPVPPLPAVA